jgi:hypothetical protein
LECTEQAPSSWDAESHGAQFAKELVPSFEGDTTAGGRETGQEFVKTGQAMRGQGDGEGDTINEPPQENLDGGPGAITFEKFFDRGGFLSVAVLGSQGAKDGINGMQEDSFGPPAPFAIALD